MLPHPKYVYTYSQDAGRSKAHTSVRAQRLQVTLQLARREKQRTSLKQMLSIKEKKIHSGPFPVPLSRYKVREKFNSGTASQNGIPLVLVHCKILVFYCLSWRGKAKKKKKKSKIWFWLLLIFLVTKAWGGKWVSSPSRLRWTLCHREMALTGVPWWSRDPSSLFPPLLPCLLSAVFLQLLAGAHTHLFIQQAQTRFTLS